MLYKIKNVGLFIVMTSNLPIISSLKLNRYSKFKLFFEIKLSQRLYTENACIKLSVFEIKVMKYKYKID